MYILSNSSLNFENRITDDTKCVSTSTVIINLLESFKLFDCIQAFLAPASFYFVCGGGGGGGWLKISPFKWLRNSHCHLILSCER